MNIKIYCGIFAFLLLCGGSCLQASGPASVYSEDLAIYDAKKGFESVRPVSKMGFKEMLAVSTADYWIDQINKKNSDKDKSYIQNKKDKKWLLKHGSKYAQNIVDETDKLTSVGAQIEKQRIKEEYQKIESYLQKLERDKV